MATSEPQLIDVLPHEEYVVRCGRPAQVNQLNAFGNDVRVESSTRS